MYWGLLQAVLGLYMCLIFWMRVNRISNELKINAKLIDSQLVTIDDYTVCGRISKQFYDDVID